VSPNTDRSVDSLGGWRYGGNGTAPPLVNADSLDMCAVCV